MFIDFLKNDFASNGDSPAIIWNDKPYSYNWLAERIVFFDKELSDNNISSGNVVALTGDFSPNSIALLLALIEKAAIIVTLTRSIEVEDKKFGIAEVERIISLDNEDNYLISDIGIKASHEFYEELRKRNHPGLVLFSSGTSGEPKGAVHDFTNLLEKFKTKRKAFRTVNFLLFDHWGGLNTMFHTISNSGTILALADRSPDAVCEFIQKHKIELLPASPTFLNLLIVSGAYKRYDLSSLKLITYGTEPMPEITLKKIKEIFPDVTLQQTYGLIELGVLRSKSKSDDSLWVKLGGEGFQTRVVDGILQIKSHSTILGYLNAPTPITPDGWFITGDRVETEGEYFRILGRKSEVINVGGEKVFPAEVENVIYQHDNVLEVMVYGEKNFLTGNIVCADITPKGEIDEKDFKKSIKDFCRERLQSYKVPVKINIVMDKQHNERFKKIRYKEKSSN
ncbi:MAG: AMP-binding protein [Ignavibacteriae bacterium]|nr:AMP-binding protein [Ignavibacteriota bacterium]MCB9244065.1 AMP-binding protein [Ignavibacteriales bacterium]